MCSFLTMALTGNKGAMLCTVDVQQLADLHQYLCTRCWSAVHMLGMYELPIRSHRSHRLQTSWAFRSALPGLSPPCCCICQVSGAHALGDSVVSTC